jgi:hypothetical protein
LSNRFRTLLASRHLGLSREISLSIALDGPHEFSKSLRPMVDATFRRLLQRHRMLAHLRDLFRRQSRWIRERCC